MKGGVKLITPGKTTVKKPSLIRINLKQKTTTSFNLIAICGRSYLIGNYEILFY